jgi:CubicO group peptidase (beta-lactamase class C family)
VAVIATLPSASLAQTGRDARLKTAYERLDAYIAREMRAKNIPGLSLALTDRNRLLRASTYGYADTKLQKNRLKTQNSKSAPFQNRSRPFRCYS